MKFDWTDELDLEGFDMIASKKKIGVLRVRTDAKSQKSGNLFERAIREIRRS